MDRFIFYELGAAKTRCAYLFANRRADRMKVLVHDGVEMYVAGCTMLASREVSPARETLKKTFKSGEIRQSQELNG
ncbi:hypothetical protein ACXPVS_27100 [Pseudomonas sp. Ma2-10]